MKDLNCEAVNYSTKQSNSQSFSQSTIQIVSHDRQMTWEESAPDVSGSLLKEPSDPECTEAPAAEKL